MVAQKGHLGTIKPCACAVHTKTSRNDAPNWLEVKEKTGIWMRGHIRFRLCAKGLRGVLLSAPALSMTKALSMEQFQFTLAGASGSNYQIQVSSDLSNWKLLRTVKLANSATNILDSTTNQTPRFYRAKLVP